MGCVCGSSKFLGWEPVVLVCHHRVLVVLANLWMRVIYDMKAIW